MKINEILVEAATNQRVAGGVPPAVTNLKANQARTAAFNQSKLATAQAQPTSQLATAGTTQAQPAAPATAGTTQATTRNVDNLNPGKANSALGSFLRGAGATQGADAVDAYATAQQNTDDGYFDHGQWIKGPKPATAQAQPATQQAGQPAQAQPVDYDTDDDWGDDEEQVVAPTSSGNTLFSDPAAFKAEWDKYVESKSATAPYQLIADPAMLAVLKDMWMRTGGTNLKESKKNTRKAA